MPAPAVQVAMRQTPVTIEQLIAGMMRVLDAQGVTYTPEALAAASGVCNAETSYKWIWCWNFGNVDWTPGAGGPFYVYTDSSTKRKHRGIARASMDEGLRPWLYELRRRPVTWAAAMRGDTDGMAADMKRTRYYEAAVAPYARNVRSGYQRSIEIARRLVADRSKAPPAPPPIVLQPVTPTPAKGSTGGAGGALAFALVAAAAVAWWRRRA